MRHGVAGYKLGRDSEHRKAMFRNMAISLFTHGQITTTGPKAKAVQPFVEKLVSLARKGDLASRRRIIQRIGNPILVDFEIDWDDPPTREDGYRVNMHKEKLVDGPRVVTKLIEEIAPRYADRPGGYTRIVKLAKHRIGDGADLVVLQLVSDDEKHNHRSKSRRRQIQDNRTAFAAKVRKGKGADEEESKAPAEEEASATEEVTESVEAPAPEAEAPATEAAETAEAPAEEVSDDSGDAPKEESKD